MSRREKVWMAVAIIFIIGNVAGGIYAAAMGEPMHAGLHAVLTLVGVFVATAMTRGRAQKAVWGTQDAPAAPPSEITDRLSQLEHSVDAVAIEVERIGEGQRFMTKVLTQDKQREESSG